MRFTGGQARGRRLTTPRGLRIRPTSDRVREALFDVLGGRVRGASFLDVFAGTGAVGCDALSRGAARVVFVERDREALEAIRRNADAAPWEGTFEIVRGEATDTLQAIEAAGTRFDVVFLDPPYDAPDLGASAAIAARLLRPGGMLIVEHRSATSIACPPPTLPFRTYPHGQTALTACRVADPSSA